MPHGMLYIIKEGMSCLVNILHQKNPKYVVQKNNSHLIIPPAFGTGVGAQYTALQHSLELRRSHHVFALHGTGKAVYMIIMCEKYSTSE